MSYEDFRDYIHSAKYVLQIIDQKHNHDRDDDDKDENSKGGTERAKKRQTDDEDKAFANAHLSLIL